MSKETVKGGPVNAAAKKPIEPFKTQKTKATNGKPTDTVTPPPDIAEAIDQFRDRQEQARHFEGEAVAYKDKVNSYAQEEYAKRMLTGAMSSFKILGEETMVTYVVSDSSGGMSEEDVEAFTGKWGAEATATLITRDFHSIRFDPDVLEANYDAVVESLQSLPSHILERLFKPMLMKAREGSPAAAKKFADTTDKFVDIIKDLKIKNYIK